MSIKVWISAFRLRTLPLSLSGIILGSFIALSKGFWDWNIFIFSIFTTVLFQIVSNLANDLGDSLKGADTNDRVGPERAVQSGVISKNQMKKAVVIFSILSLISSIFLIYFASVNLTQSLLFFYLVLAVSCVLAAIFYTIGKKAYGYNGLGDIFVFVFFGLVSVLGVYTLYSTEFYLFNLFPAASIGLLSTAVLNLNNMRDQVNDRKVNKKTLVVKMGAKRSVIYHVSLILVAITSFLFFLYLQIGFMAFFILLICIPLFSHIKKVLSVKEDFKRFDPELKKVALTTFLISIFISIIINL